ncbi:MAG: T9SS type A sorting domain-containing protein [Bacteroidetes bacterium]|nr:T9SS type A sorting domain-containing protein [Bacteroidota bacterium]
MKTRFITKKLVGTIMLTILLFTNYAFAQLNVTLTSSASSLPLTGGSATFTANVTGGTPPYTYQWSYQSANSSNTYTVTQPGRYAVAVTDANAATGFAVDSIFNPGPFTAQISTEAGACANYCSGKILIYGITGASRYSIEVNGVPSYQFSVPVAGDTIKLYDICPQVHGIKITGDPGQSIIQSITVPSPPYPPFHTWITASPDTIGPKEKTKVTIHHQGGSPPYESNGNNGYMWSNDTTTSYYSILPGYYYIGSVGDANGACINPVGADIPAKVYGYSGAVAYDDYALSTDNQFSIWVLDNDKNISFWNNTLSDHRIVLTSITTQPLHGTVGIVNGNPQSIRYTHDGSGIWIDSFTYRICDTLSIPNCDTAAVYINTECYPGSGGYCMWPGDADNSGIVDNSDLLAIGLGYNILGSIRWMQGNTFIATSATPWADTLPDGTNLLYTDCNGDGTVNANDTVAILQNFGYHTVRSMADNHWRSNIPSLQPITEQDSLKHGDTLTIDLYLGNSNTPIADAYGIAFTINYDALMVDTSKTKVVFGDSWLGNASDKISISKDLKAIGQIKCALTRIDHSNRSGQGPIGQVCYVITTDNINGKDLSYYQNIISISDIKLINAIGEEQPVNAGRDTTTIEYFATGILDIDWNSKINLYPNPANNSISITSPQLSINSISITNVLGETVLSANVNGSSASVNISALQPGIYFTQLHTGKGTFTKRLMIAR